MSISRPILFICALSSLFTGCAVPTSPVASSGRPPSSLSQIAVMAGSAAAGAAIGDQVGGDNGALIGAGAGAIVGGLANNAAGNWYRRAIAEAKEEGRREAALEAQEKAWNNLAAAAEASDANKSARPQSKVIYIEYPPGTYEGVNYGTRTLPAPSSR